MLVDNNFYTNLMARENLRDAVGAVEYLKEHAPEDLKRLEEKLDFSVEELGLWRETVSYTHLDVYKRQDVTKTIIATASTVIFTVLNNALGYCIFTKAST